MKFRAMATVGLAAAFLAAGLTTSAQASTVEGLAQEDAVLTQQHTDYAQELVDLAGIQTAEEIEVISASERPKELLVDGSTGKTISAIEVEAGTAPLALSPLSPGCSTTSLCMLGAYPYGYVGTGVKTGSWKNITRVQTGDRTGVFDWNGIRNAYGKNTGVNLTNGIFNITRIERR